MDPLWIPLVGMIVVLGSILIFRLHAFVALLLGAFTVGLVSPGADLGTSLTKLKPGSVAELGVLRGEKTFNVRLDNLATQLVNANQSADKKPQMTSELAREFFQGALAVEVDDRGNVTKVQSPGVGADVGLKPGDRFISINGLPLKGEVNLANVSKRVGIAFGNTAGALGIMIAMASIIGTCLLESGGADRIVRSAVRLLGESRAALAFMSASFLLGIPVFFDTVFFLMIPLGKAIRLRTGSHYLLYVMSIVAGGTITHSLVPPTPGPMYVAKELNVSQGAMMIGGCIVGAITCIFAYFYAKWCDRRWDVPLRETEGASLEELGALSRRDESELPPLWLALAPILLPVILIGGYSAIEKVEFDPGTWQAQAKWLFEQVGNANVALTISAAVALATQAWKQRASKDELGKAVSDSLTAAGMVLLIVAAGGAFGGMLKECGITQRIGEMQLDMQSLSIWILPIAFVITAAIRTAQGSATVAMQTAVGVVAPLLGQGTITVDPLYVALAIGCGSKPIIWMNDSGFWAICKMSGLTEKEMLKTITPMVSVMGVIGLIATMIGAWFWPVL